jgi:hypothetical protein
MPPGFLRQAQMRMICWKARRTVKHHPGWHVRFPWPIRLTEWSCGSRRKNEPGAARYSFNPGPDRRNVKQAHLTPDSASSAIISERYLASCSALVDAPIFISMASNVVPDTRRRNGHRAGHSQSLASPTGPMVALVLCRLYTGPACPPGTSSSSRRQQSSRSFLLVTGRSDQGYLQLLR